MNERIHDQLDKILALADSNFDAEAVVAVRKARQVLSRGGLSFGDLARAATTPPIQARIPGQLTYLAGQKEHLESEVHYLRQQLEDLKAQMQTQDLQVDFWRRRVAELEQGAAKAHDDAERWKKLARETAERLWDIGQKIHKDEFTSAKPAADSVPAEPVKRAAAQ